ncbi:MAG: tetratricopeptide repeat protein [Planctomycetota bacterium]
MTTAIARNQPRQQAPAGQAGKAGPLPVVVTNPNFAGSKAGASQPREPQAMAFATDGPLEPSPTASTVATRANPPAPKPLGAKPPRSYPITNPVPESREGARPSRRAVALLADANQHAQTAKTEAQFTNLVQRCRHVLAIDNSKTVVKYSKQLASWALNRRGELRADEGRRDEALTDFADALAMDPTRWRAIHNRGVLLAQSGDFAEAFDAFNATIELNPKFAKAYSNRASLYVQAGDFESALEDYSLAITADPDLAIAHKGQGRVCHMLGQMERALRHLDAAVLLAPRDASVAGCRADLLVDMGRYNAARLAYADAIRLDPNLASAYRNLSWLQSTCPDRRYAAPTEAVANANKALELSGVEDDISLDTLAAALASAGDFRGATEAIRRAIELAPASDQPVYIERLSLYESGKAFTSEPVQQAGFESPRR